MNDQSSVLPNYVPKIGVLGSSDVEGIATQLRERVGQVDVATFNDSHSFFIESAQHSFDFVVISSLHFSQDDALLLRQLKLLEQDPAVLIVTAQKSEPSEILSWLNAGADRVLLHNDRFAEEVTHQLASLERNRKAAAADTLGRARSAELVKRLSEKAKRFEEFGMTIAHDIRGPLGNIQMQLEYVLDSFGHDLPDRCSEVMQRVIGNAERLQTMVQGMYQYAKLGAQAAHKSSVDLNALVRSVISDLNIDDRLDVTIQLQDLPHVWGNEDLLRRVFINLFSNAVKYSDKDSIVLSIASSKREDTNLGETAVLYFDDNGPGIPKVKRNNLLSMYVRGEGETVEGLGVGLSVIRRICELHFGQVSIEESPLGGARFIIELPCEKIEGV